MNTSTLPGTPKCCLYLFLWILVVAGKIPSERKFNGFLKANSHQIVAEVLQQLSKEMNGMNHVNRTFHDYLGEMSFTLGGQWMSLYWRKMHHVLQCLEERFRTHKSEMEELLSVLKKKEPDRRMWMTNISTMDACPFQSIWCIHRLRYRTHDGSCNNLNNPQWGKALIPLLNDLPPDYADGYNAPRISNTGSSLPSARSISISIFQDQDNPSQTLSFMFMVFGQLLAHDTGLTGVSVLFNDTTKRGGQRHPSCGYDGCQTAGVENKECFPIALPQDEPYFINKSCLMFVRSLPVSDLSCCYGPRHQLNQITSYIDASFVYGSSDEEAAFVRDWNQTTRGLLKTAKAPHPHWQPLLPQTELEKCVVTNKTAKCFLAGDPRANEHITLVSLHTAFVRLHNQLESKLHAINPYWGGERLYQESRKVVGAIVQHVTYNEYLPLVLGNDLMKKYDLIPTKTGYWHGYNERSRPDTTNLFQTAAFRFGHSLISNTFRLMQNSTSPFQDISMSNGFFRPHELYESKHGAGVDRCIFGMAVKPIQVADRHFANQVTKNLFTKSPPHGMGTDLPAKNVQRGRDHGLPSYNRIRRWCDLATGTDFFNLPDIPEYVQRKLAALYDNVDDIDLYVGGMVEKHLPNASVGPTFGCIIGRQFQKFRSGDRFWYETGHPGIAFTPVQLTQIRKVRLAKILCDVSDAIHHIQPWILLQPGNYSHECQENSANCKFNELMPCSEFEEIDLAAWSEQPRRSNKG